MKTSIATIIAIAFGLNANAAKLDCQLFKLTGDISLPQQHSNLNPRSGQLSLAFGYFKL